MVDPHLVRQLGLKEEGTGWIVGITTEPVRVPLVSVDSAAIGHCPQKTPRREIDVARGRTPEVEHEN